MSSLSGLLPAPVHQHPGQDYGQQQQHIDNVTALVARIPPYGKRAGWKPKKPEDFGDGGAFPEIHCAQYPLDMGRKKKTATKAGSTIALQVDAQGNVAYDAIAKRGHNSKQIVQSQFKDLVPLHERADVGEISLSRPSEEEVKETADRTRAALEKISKTKIAAAQPKNVVSNNKPGAPTYIRYTAANQNAGPDGVKQRVIKMVEMPVDPMEPPKHKHKKVPRGPPSPPPPVLHSPPRKVTAQEQASWVIPPCISNWKNAKGFTIPLDKRLAADGRGLQDVQINDKFAKVAEALGLAARHAQDEVRQRALMQQKVAEKEKEAKEQSLRALAQRARDERAGIAPSSRTADEGAQAPRDDSESEADSDEDEAKQRAARERDALRKERQQEREKELRMSRMGAEQKAKVMARSEGRDISEKIALGLAKPTQSKDSMYDSRLFNQTSGLGSGFKDDESYSVYDKPMFTHTGSSVYRPKRSGGDGNDEVGNEDDIARALASDRFGSAGISARSFKGTEGGRNMQREGPVAFEKEDDFFGLDKFNKADSSKKRSGQDNSSAQDGKRRRD
ncbi:mRNA splicing protein [Lobosporangium transversale]|uniref:Pre-mRNA-processing protein 45 n=1 Tax=Lobosporangium transversale TaxID=64571 RepID=A0A1Y2GPI7_9FUNG|nr:SKIP/SNW domain-domain-containing protein [Lobosporangium transversale]KAF9898246.1 mRNA splicing protein [Lobosporangium transversale]ORZ18211.1 SKIP/SNW domain-domain-containing protein [Lobosporangium transversale]|eukprot:XP_021882006.1 SKIP/SNW domain-domain-containing protein [Lobosporangium transversale]